MTFEVTIPRLKLDYFFLFFGGPQTTPPQHTHTHGSRFQRPQGHTPIGFRTPGSAPGDCGATFPEYCKQKVVRCN